MKNRLQAYVASSIAGESGLGRRLRKLLLATSLAAGSLFAGPAFADVPTDLQVSDAVKGGLQYLCNDVQFHDNGDGSGYWPDSGASYPSVIHSTAAAIAALVETGKSSQDAACGAKVAKGIKYLLAQQKANGGIYGSYDAYETGMSLVALSLYGKATTTDDAYKTKVRNAVTWLKSYQNIEGSQRGGDYGPNGEATATNTTACGASYKTYYGAWGYYPGDGPNGKCQSGGDLSNTQFIVMGLYYASGFLGDPIATAPWAKALLYFLKNQQAASGGFQVYATSNPSPELTGTSSALWCLAMIGQLDAKKAPTDANTMLANALTWYGGSSYSWNYSGSYLYFIYGMSKALTSAIGPAASVGTHLWVADMKTELINNASYHKTVPATTDTVPIPRTDFWLGAGLDPGIPGRTAWALLSLAFASTTTESTEKFQSDTAVPDYQVKGLATLSTTNGVTITSAQRRNVAGAALGKNVVLPIGAFEFTLNRVPVGGTTTLSITPPAGALDKTNPNSFLNADGTLKKNIKWFKIKGGNWTGQASVPIVVDVANNVIRITLKDGGPEDDDGVANGKIVDPGAPGFGEDDSVVATTVDDSFGCSSGNGQFDPTLLLLLFGGVAFLVRRRQQ